MAPLITMNCVTSGHNGNTTERGEAVTKRTDRIDPTWPSWSEEDHPVSELAAPVQGALSPFGEVTFPLPADQLPYQHPHTEINRSDDTL
jgi:hypothetical protein